MGLFDSVSGFFDSAVGFVADPVQSILHQISGTYDQVDSTVKGIGGLIGGGILIQNQLGDSPIFDSLSTTLDSISGLVSDLSETIKGVVTPIADGIHSVTNLVNQINDEVIKPIVDPIKGVYDTVNTLITELQRDIHSGIEGYLRLGQDITNAFNNVNAIMVRTVQQLGAANAETLNRTIVPALSTAAAQPLKEFARVFTDPVQKFHEQEKDLPPIRLPEEANTDDYIKQVTDAIAFLQSSNNPLSWIMRQLMDLINAAQFLSISREPYLDLIREGIRHQHPTTRLTPSEALAAYHRGVIPATEAYEEIGHSGYDQARIATLARLFEVQPTYGQIVEKMRRDIITRDQANEEMQKLGYTPDESLALLVASLVIPSPQQIQEYLHRGVIDLEGAKTFYKWLGYDVEETNRALAVSDELPRLADIIENVVREGAAEANVARASLGSKPPDVVMVAGQQLGLSVRAIEAVWTNHWTLLPANLITAAYFKGLINHEQLIGALRSAAVPDDLHAVWIDMQRPLIPSRTIPSMLVHGVINEVKALELLEKQGFAPTDAELYIKYARATETPGPSAAEQALHGLSQTTILNLYDQGAIPRDQTINLLTSIGIGSQAAELAVQLVDLKTQGDERAAMIDFVLAQAKAGIISMDQVQSDLLAAGLTNAEVTKAFTKLLTQSKVKDKLPTRSELDQMWASGVLNDAEYANALSTLGYSDNWAMKFLDLNKAKATTPPAG